MLAWSFLGVRMGWGVENGRRNSDTVQEGNGLILYNLCMCHKWVLGFQSMYRGCQVFLSSCYCCAFMAREIQSCFHAETNPSFTRLEVFGTGRGDCPTFGVSGMLVLLPPTFLPHPALTPACGKGLVGLCSSRTAPRRVRSALPNGNLALFTSCTSTRGTARLLLQAVHPCLVFPCVLW